MAKSTNSERSQPTQSGIRLWQPNLGGRTPIHPQYKVKSGWIDRNWVESARLNLTPTDPPRLHSLQAASTGSGAMFNGTELSVCAVAPSQPPNPLSPLRRSPTSPPPPELRGGSLLATAAGAASSFFLSFSGIFFNSRFQYKDNVHNDGEVMRGTMNVITRLARTMNERLDAMAEAEQKYYQRRKKILKKRKAVGSDDSTQSPDDDDGDDDDGAAAGTGAIGGYGLKVSFQDMKIIQYHPINKKEAKGKHKNNMGDMKANKGKQDMIGDMGLLIHPFLIPQNCHIQISALVVGQVTWAIFKLLGMVVSSLKNNQEKVQANKQRHLEPSKEDSKTSPILCSALDIPNMGQLLNVMRQRMRVRKYQIDKREVVARAHCTNLSHMETKQMMLKWKREWPTKGNRTMWWLILHATLWMIRDEKNRRIFSRTAWDVESLSGGICRIVGEWVSIIRNVDLANSSLSALMGGRDA
ncbi:hypothetical protein Taro_026778 [Colocasia esculenta]|uniref:Uncharacterized protein n=1 Tax=Colocasia esculenta TaxID=4460 RepID=A0A843VI49_COLES|nr:hypothetical protein [Colocasia esculenta]